MLRREIWISSHITHEKGLEYLKECIESLSCLDLNIVLSYSGLMIVLPSNIIVFNHPKRLTQFQHIQYMLSQRNLGDNDMILFLDDDDKLLTPSNIKCKGTINTIKCYYGNKPYIKQVDERKFIYTIPSPFDEIEYYNLPGVIGLQINLSNTLRYDFSGTVIRKQYLEQFLKGFNKGGVTFKYMENTVDTKLMDFIIEKLDGNLASNPTVFKRVKPYRSEWIK